MAFVKAMIEAGKYKDHKGNLFRVIGSARNAITLAEVVIYEALFKNPAGRYWVIPLAKFKDKILVEGKKVPRFTKVQRSQPK